MMSNQFSELDAFRIEVRDFLESAATAEIREAGRKTTSVFAPFKQAMAWQKILWQRRTKSQILTGYVIRR